MLSRHRGQEFVKGGTYINYKNGEFVNVSREGGNLPGITETRYIQVPLPLMLVLGPVLGLAFILFMPAIGVAIITMFVVRALTGGVAAFKGEASKTATPMAAGVSFLQGGKADIDDGAVKDLENKAEEVEGLINELEEEIRQRRKENNK